MQKIFVMNNLDKFSFHRVGHTHKQIQVSCLCSKLPCCFSKQNHPLGLILLIIMCTMVYGQDTEEYKNFTVQTLEFDLSN